MTSPLDRIAMRPTSRRRPTVLAFVPYYEPAFRAGGPVRTLRNMVDLLGAEVDFRIFTRAHDLGSSDPLPGISPGTWIERDGATVFYGDARHRSARSLATMVRKVDPAIIYCNSFFDASLSVHPLVLRRVGLIAPDIEWLIAPRGEFAPGALAIKRWKKWPFLQATRLAGLHQGLVWHASSEHEAEDIRRVMGRVAADIRVAPNLTTKVGPFVPRSAERRERPLSVCFLARISPVKNLRFAIDVVKTTRRPIHFTIYGPVEDARYWKECQRAMEGLQPGSVIQWRGELPPENVRETLALHDLFLFPSRGENFGHAIFEALAAGVPVLVSDRTPWRDLDERGSGWVRPLDDLRAFVEVLEIAADREGPQREAARRAAHAQALEVSRSEAVLGANRRLFVDCPSVGLPLVS